METASANQVMNETVAATQQTLEANQATESENSGQELEDSVETQKAEQKAEQERKKVKKLKLKYNGKEFEEELPFEIEEDPKAMDYLTRKLQMAQLGTLKAEEYSQLESEIQEFVAELRKNPRKVLSDPRLGVDLKRFAQEIIDEEIENAKKSPEQIEFEKREAQLREKEEAIKRAEAEAQRKQQEHLEEQAFQKYNMEISSALDKSGLPKQSPYVVKKLADYMIKEIRSGNDVSAEEAMTAIKVEMIEDLKVMIEHMEPELLEDMFGTGYEKLRKYRLSKAPKPNAKAAVAKKAIDVGKVPQPEKKEPEKKTDYKTFFGI